ncbi:MAG: hypothetical protein IK130_10220 [Oscillospiraceae bacterium]|nr:hypothetical protein [Oscillospiraceae bacterium]
MRKSRLFAALASAALLLTGCSGEMPAQETVSTETAVSKVSTAAETVQTAETAASAAAEPTVSAAETTTAAEPVQTLPAKQLVTLGDSMSYGYGLANPASERYSALLTKALTEKDDITWEDYNYAVSGDRSSDLLTILNSGKVEKLADADMIVVCIGANNLLRPFTDYLKKTAEDLQNSLSDIKDLKKDNLKEYSTDDLGKLGSILGGAIKGTGINYDELQEQIDAGMDTLKTDLEAIYTKIREKNSTAPIYVMNVYNPYKNLTDVKLPGMSEPVNLYGQKRLDVLNGIISDWIKAHSDLIAVDLAAEYAKYTKPPIIGKELLGSGSGSGTASAQQAGSGSYAIPSAIMIDPHPNAEGQRIIADLLVRTVRAAS